jgi:hypothetical protein
MDGRFWLCDTRIRFQFDMTGDGIVTITDVWWMFKYAFFLPGDLLVCSLYPTRIGQFLELTPDSLYGWGSGIFSCIAWMFVWLLATQKA